ncbi:hypothetical protein ACJJTC_001430 [Scirpophaga incertulas]
MAVYPSFSGVAKCSRPVMGSSVTGARSYALRSPTRLPSVAIMGVTFMGSETFQSNLENRFAAVETTTDVNQNLMDVVRILREEGTRLCEMQRKGRKSKLSEETLGLMKERRENPPVTSSAKRTLNREISKHVERPLSRATAPTFTGLAHASLGSGASHTTIYHGSEFNHKLSNFISNYIFNITRNDSV